MRLTYISEVGGKHVLDYKYAGSDASLLYKYIVSPSAQFLVDHLIPEWLAPNTITVSGLGLVIFSHIVMLLYCPLMEGIAPSWVYLLSSLSLFTYQILDVADGKQARKTGNASPLGLLFDHGCDAFNVIVSALTMASTLQLGPTWKSFSLFGCAAVVFFFATWEEYYTGRLDLPPINGPNEGLFIMYTVHMYAALRNPSWWAEDSGILNLKYNEVFVALTILGLVPTILGNVWNVMSAVKTHQGRVAALMGLLPFGAFVLLCGFFFLSLSGETFESHPRLITWTVGLIFCKLVMHIMLSHMCHEPLWLLRKTLVTFFLMAFLIGSGFLPLAKNEDAVWIFYGLALVPYVHMVVGVIQELTTLLNISCFKVKPKEKKH